MLNAAAALAPVLVFLALLSLLDSFKLVPLRVIARALGAGALAALAALAVNSGLFDAAAAAAMPPAMVTRYFAPAVEEGLKLAFIVYTVRQRRVGFSVDAAILGFAVGAGFALVENVYYLSALEARAPMLWLVRGFGAATLHGAATAIAAIVAQALADRRPQPGWLVFLPGLAAAILIHSIYNHFVLPPVASTVILLAVLPPAVVVVFERSERATRDWVGAGLDLDVELLNLVLSPAFPDTRLGRYLQELRLRFPGPVVADMFCLMRLELELAIRAKGMLLAREAGLEVPVDEQLTAQLQEVRYLEKSIGRTGLLAIKPLQVTTHRDQWHKFLLRQTN